MPGTKLVAEMTLEELSRRREYNRKYYHNRVDKKRKVDAQRKRRETLRATLDAYKATLACQVCGESHPACLDFHHKDPEEKSIAVADAVRAGWSLERIFEEIQKCDVLCANCHRKLHWDLP